MKVPANVVYEKQLIRKGYNLRLRDSLIISDLGRAYGLWNREEA